MGNIWKAVSGLAIELHPDQSMKIARKINELESWSNFDQIKASLGSISRSQHFEVFEKECKADQSISPQQVSAALIASSITADFLDKREKIEMVWTGPLSGLVPSRHTEQVLLEVISAAQDELFIVSFVAYDIESIRKALAVANDRGVIIHVLLEESKSHGGKVDFDSVKTVKNAIPSANFYAWKNKLEEGQTLLGAVHAKCAVADREIAFISSANLTRAAMENNMELGVMVRGGNLPEKLQLHLKALVSTKIVEKI
jgi:cardiolipin synthase